MDRQKVNRMLQQAGVPLRPRGAGGARLRRGPELTGHEAGLLAAVLEQLYVVRGWSSTRIGRELGLGDRTVRSKLAAFGIDRRHSGNRPGQDRFVLDVQLLHDLYVVKELSAAEVGRATGLPGSTVLRHAHELGLAVRLGGAPAGHGADRIELIEALYSDALVASVLVKHRVPVVAAGPLLWQRLPVPVLLTDALVRDLYERAGVGVEHIRLLTGQPAVTVSRRLKAAGVVLRGAGGRSPFVRRWRAAAGVTGGEAM